jgi:hypothetical protein
MNARIIQVRPSRNPRWQKQSGWEVFEAEGVCPVYCGSDGRESALSYARLRAGYARTEIRQCIILKIGCFRSETVAGFAHLYKLKCVRTFTHASSQKAKSYGKNLGSPRRNGIPQARDYS